MGFLRKLFRGRKKTKKKPTRAEKLAAALETALAAENLATHAGIKRFHEINAAPIEYSPLLRRNIHRLEKGLSFQTRRSVFGLKFIGETVDLFERATRAPAYSNTEHKWAHDVLDRYFNAVDLTDETIAAAQKRFLACCGSAGLSMTKKDNCEALTSAPYRVGEIPKYAKLQLAVSPEFDAFHSLCRRRRSQRWFRDDPVPMDQVRAAVTAALQAPSACNRQPFDYYLTEDRATIDAIADIPLGTAGYGDRLPAIIAVVGDLANFAEPRDRHLIYIDASLATMQLMLGLTAIGLGSVPINWPDIPENHQRLREVIGLVPHQVPIMLVGLGVPDDQSIVAYSAKRTVDEILHVV
ncbi:MAG: nitroreductase family protein [Pseudomonadota bacterium]